MTAATLPLVRTRAWSPGLRLAVLGGLALAAILAFLLIDTAGNWDFALAFRGRKVAAMVLVGWATAVSTVVFQTVTNNRILTPSIMGFDAAYAFIQTALVFVLGVTAAGTLGPYGMFGINLALMVAFAAALFGWLFRRGRSLYLMVLVGIVLGTLLRGLSSLLTRVMDPTSFLVVQGNLFASFNAVHPELLGIAALIIAAASAWLWTRRRALDVLLLGRDAAIGLGINHRREVLGVLGVATVLVATSTALVGPITFLGLIVANLAYLMAGTHRHAIVLPFAALLGVVALVGGQAILEHVFGLSTVLSVIIEFVGGIAFIAIVLRGAK